MPCSGSIFECGGGWAAEVKYVRSKGLFLDVGDPRAPGCPYSIDDVKAGFHDVQDFSRGVDFPDDLKKTESFEENPQLKQIVARL